MLGEGVARGVYCHCPLFSKILISTVGRIARDFHNMAKVKGMTKVQIHAISTVYFCDLKIKLAHKYGG